MKVKNLVYYHANCLDGFASAYVASLVLPWRETQYIPISYGEEPTKALAPPEAGEILRVYILDFSFSLDTLFAIAKQHMVILLDHHVSFGKQYLEHLDEVNGTPNLKVIFSLVYSGVGLTWDYFFYPKPLPKILAAVQDRDLWKFELEGTKEICASLAVGFRGFEAWKFLTLDSQIEYHLGRGQGIRAYEKNLVQEIAALAKPVFLRGEKEPIAFGTYCAGSLASEVGNKIWEEKKLTAMTWFLQENGYCKLSFRGEGALALAEKLGGGGHEKAAGAVSKNYFGEAIEFSIFAEDSREIPEGLMPAPLRMSEEWEAIIASLKDKWEGY